MLYEKLLEFVDELMSLFEDRNKIIYKRLIILHHRLQNLEDKNDVECNCVRWLSKSDVADRVARKDVTLLKNTTYELEAEWIMNELGSDNRDMIWKWANAIIELAKDTC